jgi:hypothetical protein
LVFIEKNVVRNYCVHHTAHSIIDAAIYATTRFGDPPLSRAGVVSVVGRILGNARPCVDLERRERGGEAAEEAKPANKAHPP